MLTGMTTFEPRAIAVTTHGRYLVKQAAAGAPVLVGFHGYAEAAETEMQRLVAIPGLEGWTLASVQGLHRFYQRRSDQVVASWMTRQDRELTIADNVAYVSAAIDELIADRPATALVFAGFSQGVAMAFRAACLGRHAPAAIVSLGGDVPPDLGAEALRRSPRVLLGRGRDDRVYGGVAFEADQARLREAGATVEPIVIEGGHEWTAEFAAAAGAFLREAVR